MASAPHLSEASGDWGDVGSVAVALRSSQGFVKTIFIMMRNFAVHVDDVSVLTQSAKNNY